MADVKYGSISKIADMHLYIGAELDQEDVLSE